MSQDDFGTLRAMLQQPTIDSHWELHDLLKAAAERDLAQYEEVWLPYLHGFPHHLTEPFDNFWDFESAEAAVRLCPGCPIGLRISGDPDVDRLLRLAARCRLVRLTFSGGYMNPPAREQLTGHDSRALLASPHLKHLTHLDLSFNVLETVREWVRGRRRHRARGVSAPEPPLRVEHAQRRR